ncbi:unnamed protein product [Camellia sinensis]
MLAWDSAEQHVAEGGVGFGGVTDGLHAVRPSIDTGKGLWRESVGNVQSVKQQLELFLYGKIIEGTTCKWKNYWRNYMQACWALSKLEMLNCRGKGLPKKGQGKSAAKRNK